MAQTIKLKRSATQDAVPSTSSLALGELAINTYDGKLFIKKSVSGTESIVTIGEVGANSIGPSELASTAVTAGSYGSTSAIPVITIDADGRITSASTATISGLSANSVTSTEIAANAVGISELDVSDGTDGQVLTTDGSGNLAFEDQSGGAASATAFSTNIANGNGSTTAFTLSESPSAESKIIAFINGVFQNQDAYTISGTTITFDTAPIAGTNNVVVYVIGDVYSGESVLISNFSGNASTTAFTLANNPGNENNTQVYIDGVYQQKTTYSVSGTTLTFSSAPPTGTNNIEVVMLTSTTVNTPAAGSVVTASMADNSITGAKIVSGAVTTAKISDSNVTTAKIADSNVTTAKIADSNVTTAKIANDAVTSAKIATLDANLEFGDSVKAIFGAGSDLQIYHDGTSSYIVNTTNDLIIKDDSRIRLRTPSLMVNNDADTENMIIATQNGSVDLYYDNSKKFETSSTGVTVTGNLAVTGDLDITGNVNSYNVTDLDVTDKTITLGAGQTEANSGGSGIVIDGSGASMLWNESNTRFDFNASINTTGSIRTAGAIVSTSNTATQLKNATDQDVQHKFETNSSSDYALHRLIGTDGIDNKFIIGYGPNHVSTPQHLALKNSHASGSIGFNTGASSTERMRITSTGNVAIANTSTINAKLHIGSATATGDATNPALQIGGAGTYRLGMYTTAEGAIIDNANGDDGIIFHTKNANEAMRIDASGNVGIGAPGPSEKLEVNGKIRLGGMRLANNDSGRIGLNRNPDDGSATDSGLQRYQINGPYTGGDYLDFQNYNSSGTYLGSFYLSAGKVGIGETTPLGKLHVKEGDSGQGSVNSNFDQLVLEDDAHSGMTILSGTSSDGGIYFGDSGGNNMGQFKYKHGTNSFAFVTNNGSAEALIIDSSDNVGIGGSPTNYSDHKTLSLYGNTGTGAGFIEFNDTSGNADAVIFSDNGNLFINADYDNTTADSSIRFRVDGSSEKMRITASGGLEVGDGTNYGYLKVISDDAVTGYFDRRNGSGTIFQFRLDDSTIGSINIQSSTLQIGTGNTQLAFSDADDAFFVKNEAGANRDGSHDLGKSSARFKDLYLSGGAYIGGTGSANHLDDYEEGTFTPTFSNSNSTAVGKYTKIGNQVTVRYHVVSTGGLPSSGGQVQIGNLPFTSANDGLHGAGAIYIGPSNVSSATGGGGTIVTIMEGNATVLRLVNVDTGTFGYTLWGELEVSHNNVVTAIGTFTYTV
jgi:hypothetical protein